MREGKIPLLGCAIPNRQCNKIERGRMPMNCGIFRDEFLKFSLECSSSNNKLDFYNRAYPRLQNLVPHEMFGEFAVTLHDNHPFFHLGAGRFGSKKTYLQTSGNILPRLLFDRWKKRMKPLVIVDPAEISNGFA